MGSFEPKQHMHLSLNKEARERIKEIQDHLQENYNGMAHFVRQKLHEEQALSIEERIRKKENNLEQQKDQLQKLKRIKNERNQQDKLQTKVELLKEKQDKLRGIAEDGIMSREEVAQEELEKRVDRGYDLDMDSEIIQDAVERRLERRPDVDELVESVERLQREIEELDPECDVEFMDLEAVEVKA